MPTWCFRYNSFIKRHSYIFIFLLFSSTCLASQPQQTLPQIMSLIYEGKTKEGIRALVKVVDTSAFERERLKAAYYLALNFQSLGEYKKRIDIAPLAIDYTANFRPIDRPNISRIVGDWYIQVKEYQKAEEVFKRLLKTTGLGQKLAYYSIYRLGITYMHQNNFSKLFTLWPKRYEDKYTTKHYFDDYLYSYGQAVVMAFSKKQTKLIQIPSFTKDEEVIFFSGVESELKKLKKNQKKYFYRFINEKGLHP
jgi:tetratricopeptide (TPR) repeat protein